MLKKYKEGTLPFKPACSYDLLNGQFKAMDMYASYLEERAAIDPESGSHSTLKELLIMFIDINDAT